MLGVGTIAGRALSLVFALAVIGGLVALLARWQAADMVLTLAAPSATVAPAQERAPAVRTCKEDLGWTRPSEAEMARTVWQDNRYRDADGSVPWRMRAYYERHFVLFTTPTGSGTAHAEDLTGLATARPFGPGDECSSGYGPALANGREVAIWALGYRVAEATVAGDTLTIIVIPNQPTTRGYHMVQTIRPTATAWSARFVLANGTEVARWSTTDGELTARSVTEPCTGAVVGRVVADYGNHDPAVGELISLSGLDPHRPDALVVTNARTGPDGAFHVDAVPIGQHEGAARHARFRFTVDRCGQAVDVGIVPYPLVHPDPEGTQAFDRFMQARLRREDRAVLDLLTDELRTRLGGITSTLTQVSNPCWYRYQVVHVDQPAPEALAVRVRVYMQHWSGDNAGSLPQSREQELSFVRTSTGWRVDRIGDWENARDEPGEPHGWSTSACTVTRLTPPHEKSNSTSGSPPLPERPASARAHALEVVREFARSIGVRQDAGDVEYVGTMRSLYDGGRFVEFYAQAASSFEIDPTTEAVIAFARASEAGQTAPSAPALERAVLEQRARAFLARADPAADLARLDPTTAANARSAAAAQYEVFRWEDAQHSRPTRCPVAGQPCADPGKLVFVQIVLDSTGQIMSYTNTLGFAR